MQHKFVRGDLSILLSEDYQTYYWMGFLAADGSIYGNKRILALRLAKLDTLHVHKFANYIKCPNIGYDVKNNCRVCIGDKYHIPLIADKFDLKPRKTYNPPDISWLSGDKFISFLIGFIDGDGCIWKLNNRRDCNLQIKLHSTWLNVLQFMSDQLCSMVGVKPIKARIDKRGYALVCWSDSLIHLYLKKKTIELNLYILSRKWDKIDMNFVSRYWTAKNNHETIFKMRSEGKTAKEIAKVLNMTPESVYSVVKRRNKKLKSQNS